MSFVADPATGAWIADPYNLTGSDPFEIVGGTSLSAPCWAGLIALADQGRVAAGQAALNSTSPTNTQQALYGLPQSDYNVIAGGNNGYSAGTGYNLVTGLGTPVANLLVPDLVAWQGSSYGGGQTVSPIQNANLVYTGGGARSSDGPAAFKVFDVEIAGATEAAPVLGHSADTSPCPSAHSETVEHAAVLASPVATGLVNVTGLVPSGAIAPAVTMPAAAPSTLGLSLNAAPAHAPCSLGGADPLAGPDPAVLSERAGANFTNANPAGPGRSHLLPSGAAGPRTEASERRRAATQPPCRPCPSRWASSARRITGQAGGASWAGSVAYLPCSRQ